MDIISEPTMRTEEWTDLDIETASGMHQITLKPEDSWKSIKRFGVDALQFTFFNPPSELVLFMRHIYGIMESRRTVQIPIDPPKPPKERN